MNRYTCHSCKSEHDTDNMVAYCAACFSPMVNRLHGELDSAREVADNLMDKIENQAKIIEAMDEVVEAARHEHYLDQQTHCLTFGHSKQNCTACRAIAKLDSLKKEEGK